MVTRIVARSDNQIKLSKIIKKVDRMNRATNKQVGRFMQLTARSLAPYDTGKLFSSIRLDPKNIKHPRARVSVVTDAVGPGGFPYPRWVNQSAGFVFVNMRWNAFKPTRYGDGSHKTTAKSLQFWKTAARRTRNRFKQIALNNFNKELKVGIR